MLLNWQAPRHPCGFLERAHEIGCLQVGCLQSCRHPESGACRPAGTLQAPGRHPAGTRGRVPGACRHRQAPSRHPGWGAGCLQAPCRHPAGTQQASGIGGLQACRHPAGPFRHPEADVWCLQARCKDAAHTTHPHPRWEHRSLGTHDEATYPGSCGAVCRTL